MIPTSSFISSHVYAPVADERVAFETFQRGAGINELYLERHPESGQYMWTATKEAWETWQARAALASAPVAAELPEWEKISAKRDRDEALTPLELFVYDNEPAGDDDAWRNQLDAALACAPVARDAQCSCPRWRRLPAVAVRCTCRPAGGEPPQAARRGPRQPRLEMVGFLLVPAPDV